MVKEAFGQTELPLNLSSQSLDQSKEFTNQEKKLCKLIPKGKENSVQGSYIAKASNISLRTVRQKIHDLRVKHGLCIGATRYPPYGYYIIQNQQEFNETVGGLRATVVQYNDTISALYMSWYSQKNIEKVKTKNEDKKKA